MKKLINDPADVIDDELKGMAVAHPELRIDMENHVIYRGDAPVQGKVAVISGGGSGHEPMHGGYVGEGMLDAAVAGEVFTSPTPDQIMAATLGADSGEGVLHLVKNYTGDVLNFEMAAELAEAEGVRVRSVVIDDDVAVQDSLYTAGRRGVGGTVLIEKIVGGAAEDGKNLDELADLATKLNSNVRTMGLALSSCIVPSAGKPSFDLADDEIEIGIGIHGEPGRRREKIAPAKDLAHMLVDPILEDLDFTGSDVIVMVNGMGGTPLMELYILFGEVASILEAKGVKIARNLVGNYITALEMQGASVSLLKADAEDLKYFDAPVYTPGLRRGR